jgi:threonine/homoserine/homoserine lactone efflux protein
VSTLNATSLVLFVAFLPQFVSTTAAWPLWVQLGALGLTWTGLGAIFYFGLAAASQKLLAGRDGTADIVTRVTGAAMILMGLWLAGEQLAHLLSGVR